MWEPLYKTQILKNSEIFYVDPQFTELDNLSGEEEYNNRQYYMHLN